MDKFGFEINSKNENSKPIAVILKTNENKKNKILDMVKNLSNPMIEINDKELIPLFCPDKDQNIRIYMCGQSGCGKSYLTSQILSNYCKIYKTKAIYIFSTLDYDSSYDSNPKLKNKIHRYLLDDENVELLAELKDEDLKDSLCVFDDFLLFNPRLKKIIDSLKDILLKRGRHYNIDTIIINDKIMDGHKSKTELNQCNYIIIFPKCTNNKHLNMFIDNYLGLQPIISNLIKKVNSRWVCFSKNYPRYAVYQHGVFML